MHAWVPDMSVAAALGTIAGISAAVLGRRSDVGPGKVAFGALAGALIGAFMVFAFFMVSVAIRFE